jgi:hypothetical protein
MDAIKRELRVAFSPRAQPWWFRLAKWSLLIAVTARYRQRWWFAYGISLALTGAVALHLLYRQKTQGWQRAWGGWSDLRAGV